MKYIALSFLLLIGTTSCGLFGKSNLSPIEELTPVGEKTPGSYLVQTGDVLDVQVWGEPKVSGEVFVREDGSFTLPLVGDVPAEGLAATVIAEDVTKKLVEFIPAASVSVSILQTAPIRYYLSGKFLKAGEYRSDKEITLLQAIATGGNFQPFADESNVILIRKGPKGELRYKLDYNRVVTGDEPNPVLRAGDVIAVN